MPVASLISPDEETRDVSGHVPMCPQKHIVPLVEKFWAKGTHQICGQLPQESGKPQPVSSAEGPFLNFLNPYSYF